MGGLGMGKHSAPASFSQNQKLFIHHHRKIGTINEFTNPLRHIVQSSRSSSGSFSLLHSSTYGNFDGISAVHVGWN
jgi:hypothetical protein